MSAVFYGYLGACTRIRATVVLLSTLLSAVD